MAFELVYAMVAAIAGTFFLGFLWYGPLFGKPWMKAMGWDKLSEAELKATQKTAMPGYMLSLLFAATSTFLVWVVFGWAMAGASYSGPFLGIAIALAAWAAYALPAGVVTNFFEGGNWTLTATSLGYWGVVAVIQGTAVGLLHP